MSQSPKPTSVKRSQKPVVHETKSVNTWPAIVIENIQPCVEGGQFPAKSEMGRELPVSADIFKDGHDCMCAQILYRLETEKDWTIAPLFFLNNDAWQGSFTPEKNARYLFTVEAWVNPVATWVEHVEKKAERYPNIQSEADEGIKLIERMLENATKADQLILNKIKSALAKSKGVSSAILQLVTKPEFRQVLLRQVIKEQDTIHEPFLELIVDRTRAVFGAWYEMFPRSQSRIPGQSGTFEDCIVRLPEIKAMGFDVLYLPPIHPIGSTHRKGRNNSVKAEPNDPGSPWAIGNRAGGHKAIHPELGTLDDFRKFVKHANRLGIEIALDFAIQCSPDHPYVKEHPEWFYHLPDGTIRYAENPPKKYEDIYPINFHTPDWEALWQELKSVVEFWIEQGVKIFRVDNPHTKAMYFWKWLIREIQQKYPETIFLAEAFTRPKVMKFLAKSGFTQSYTYFTWRNAKKEIREYFEELTQTEMKHYFRGNLFANTPDILHEILQKGGRPAFKMRAALAATLLPTWGIYNSYELCENQAKGEGSEDYLHSEKYEYKHWDWERPGNIKAYITRLNTSRRENPALQQYGNLRFFESRNENVICYGRWTADKQNIIVVCINLDPYHTQEDMLQLPIWEFGIEEWQLFIMEDLITGTEFKWRGKEHYLRLDPQFEPAHVFLLKK